MAAIKEIYVGVTTERDKDGKVIVGSLYMKGKPIGCDVYTPDHLPMRGTELKLCTWDELCVWAQLPHVKDCGVTIFYEDTENSAIKKAMADHKAQQKKDAEEQARVLMEKPKKVEIKPEVK